MRSLKGKKVVYSSSEGKEFSMQRRSKLFAARRSPRARKRRNCASRCIFPFSVRRFRFRRNPGLKSAMSSHWFK